MSTILLVDDDPQLLPMLQRILRSAKEGWTVTPAASGKEAIRHARSTRFDLVITDILMPDGDGLETIHALRSSLPDAKIIAMTGGGHFVGTDVLRIAEALGAHAVLKKPFLPADLLAEVRRLLAPGAPLPGEPGTAEPAPGDSTPRR